MRRIIEDEPEVEPAAGDAFDWVAVVGVPHGGGAWSRHKGEDVMRCGEHGLRPDEH